jgi:hypothetical protein
LIKDYDVIGFTVDHCFVKYNTKEITSHIIRAHMEELHESFEGYPDEIIEIETSELIKYHLNNAVWDFDKGLILKLGDDKLITHA